ncbi:MAG: single-stranded DNA-specific DHH superfamily exonuclease [Candidatus Woesearchaeota archaeon]|jgi:single-stranded DNA-specific DHH superfamily exonuclease
MDTYKITIKDKVSLLEAYLQNIEKSEKICLLYDDDADGMCAGVVTHTALTKLGFEDIVTHSKCPENNLFSEEFNSRMQKNKIKAVICVDFEPVNWQFATQEELSKLPFDLIIIDHHHNQTEIYDGINAKSQKDIIFIHPQNTGECDTPGQYCTAKFAFDVFSCFLNLDDITWKILPGMIGDMAIIKWPEYIKFQAEADGHMMDEGKKEVFMSPYGEFSTSTGIASGKNFLLFEDMFEVLLHAKSIDEALEQSPDFTVEESAFYDYFENFKEKGIYFKDINTYFIEIKSEYSMCSPLSSITSYVADEFNFIFYQKTDTNHYLISLRSQHGNYHLGQIIREICKEVGDATGGGHAQAAGARCTAEKLDEILAKIRERLAIKN